MRELCVAVFCAWCVAACERTESSTERAANAPSQPSASARGEVVSPPFDVRGDLEGLLLVWYDAEGAPHSASRRSDVPEDRRAAVRIDALSAAPGQRLDADHVYVADLRAPLAGGAFRVELWSRDAFESRVVPASEPVAALPAGADVIIYGASWCGACKQAAAFLRSREISFVEKDIEKEPAARAEMQAKARVQGVPTGSIPLIDVRGKLLSGFDPQKVLTALDRGT